MKKILIVSFLVLAIVASVLAGTLANYTISVDQLATGSVVGKEFIFLKDGADTFQQGIKIAPTEDVVWQFAVKNYNNNAITETDLYYKLTFDVHATSSKSAIDPLVIKVKDSNGNVIKSVTGTGKMEVTGAFPHSAQGQKSTYTVDIYWPSNDAVDINYAGGNYSTTIDVSAVASQVPFGSDTPPPPPAQNDATIKFETTAAWQNGGSGGPYGYQFLITITNNSDKSIDKWRFDFLLEDQISSYWNVNSVGNLGAGQYKFVHPDHYNINIDPGQSVTFGGIGIGHGDKPLTSAKINGKDADVSNIYNHLIIN